MRHVSSVCVVLVSTFTDVTDKGRSLTLLDNSAKLAILTSNERGSSLQLANMNSVPQSDPVALQLAEDVLRHIYGDDLKGCAVSLESVASIVTKAISQQQRGSHELLDLYEKLVEALHLLSNPPDASKISDPAEWQKFLSQRLDSIHALTTKAIETTARVRPKKSS